MCHKHCYALRITIYGQSRRLSLRFVSHSNRILFSTFRNLGRRGRRPLRFVPQSHRLLILHFAFCIGALRPIAPTRCLCIPYIFCACIISFGKSI